MGDAHQDRPRRDRSARTPRSLVLSAFARKLLFAFPHSATFLLRTSLFWAPHNANREFPWFRIHSEAQAKLK